MATPGGIYLSNGLVYSGSKIGLSLSILVLAASLLVACGITVVFVWAIDDAVPVPLLAIRLGASLPGEVNYEPAWRALIELMQFLFFFAILRLTPLSGYHAAEHMTVHAIEVGCELTEENVRQMPRVHGRCGSNILGWLLPLLILVPITRYYPWYVVVPLALAGGWVLRRLLGSAVHWLFTTSSPSARQLRAGVEAGRELLRRSRAAMGTTVSRFQAARNRGLVHMAVTVVILLSLQFALAERVAQQSFDWLDPSRPGHHPSAIILAETTHLAWDHTDRASAPPRSSQHPE
jgi:hypothetical protein